MAEEEELLAPADRIKWAMARKRLKGAPELVRITGINSSTARAYLNGGREPSLESALHLGEKLEVSGFWLFNNEGSPDDPPPPKGTFDANSLVDAPKRNSTRACTVYSAALAGPDGEIELATERSHQVAIPTKLERVQDAYGVMVSGDSMKDRFNEGDTVFANPNEPVARDDDVIVQIHANGDVSRVYGLIKRFVRFDDEELVLRQLNPPRELRYPRSIVKSVHRVVTVDFR